MKRYVTCLICGREFKKISPAHMRMHGISFSEYLKKFPRAELVSDLWRSEQSERTSNYIKRNPGNWRKRQEKVAETMRSKKKREEMSAIKKEHWEDQELRGRYVSSAKQRWSKKSEREKQSERKKEFVRREPEKAKRIGRSGAKRAWELKGDVLRKKCRERFKKKEERKKQSKRIKRFMDSPKGDLWKKKQSEKVIEYFQKNPKEASRRMREFLKTCKGKEWCKRMSKIKLEQYTNDPSILKRWSRACQMKPNKKEIQLLTILKQNRFGFKFVGDGKVIIGGKMPDYINENKKLLIELFGDYWHRGENPKNRISHFKKYGYTCLVVWERELKNEKQLLRKIDEFISLSQTEPRSNN